MAAQLPDAVQTAVTLQIDDAFDAAARTGFAVSAGVVAVAALFAAFALRPQRKA